MCSLIFTHHQLSSAQQIRSNHQSVYRPGLFNQFLFFEALRPLIRESALASTNYLGCVLIGSSSKQPTQTYNSYGLTHATHRHLRFNRFCLVSRQRVKQLVHRFTTIVTNRIESTTMRLLLLTGELLHQLYEYYDDNPATKKSSVKTLCVITVRLGTAHIEESPA